MQELVSPSGTAGFLPRAFAIDESSARTVGRGSPWICLKWDLQSLVIYVLLLKDRLGWAHFRIHQNLKEAINLDTVSNSEMSCVPRGAFAWLISLWTFSSRDCSYFI